MNCEIFIFFGIINLKPFEFTGFFFSMPININSTFRITNVTETRRMIEQNGNKHVVFFLVLLNEITLQGPQRKWSVGNETLLLSNIPDPHYAHTNSLSLILFHSDRHLWLHFFSSFSFESVIFESAERNYDSTRRLRQMTHKKNLFDDSINGRKRKCTFISTRQIKFSITTVLPWFYCCFFSIFPTFQLKPKQIADLHSVWLRRVSINL